MTEAVRWQRIKSICDAALRLSAADRGAFIASQCAEDDGLRREVEALLTHAVSSDRFLSMPLGAVAAGVLTTDWVGRRFGTYEITSAIGAGGMGDVYRARDTRLGRDVAVKMLPASFAADAERRARFEREARVLAALNNPHIASIYDVEDVDGATVLILELVAGETLADRLGRGPTPVPETLSIACQIAEALEAAHEKGIIHRDLKPSNIALTADRNVKILDFGLAKAIEPSVAGEYASVPITSSVAGVAPDLMGTPGYMAPEQLMGAGDRRSDIWAFGCVLYEMLTDRPAFIGQNLPLTAAAVMSKMADWDALPSNTPVALRQLLQRCLEKDPRRRLQAIGDARIQIEDLLESDPDDADPVAVAEKAVTGQRPGARDRAVRFVAVSATVLLGVAAVAGWIWLGRRAPTPVKVSFDILTEISPAPNQLSVSPDGTRLTAVIATPSGLSLWLRRLDEVVGQTLVTSTAGNYSAFWSADSRSLAFFANQKLNRIDLSGGPPQPVCDAPAGRGGAWNRDGVILFAPSASGPLFRIPAAGGTPRQVTELDATRGDKAHAAPQFLPDGHHFIFFIQSARREHGGLYLGSLDSKQTTLLVSSDGMGLFAAPDHLLFLRNATLMAQRFDARRLELRDAPFPIADNVAVNSVTGMAGVAVSDTGVLAYRASDATDRILRWVDRAGRTLGEVGTVDFRQNVAVAPGTDRIVETRVQGESGDLWINDLQRESSSRFTLDSAVNDNAVWSPNGEQIVFSSTRGSGVRNLYRKDASGATPEELLLESDRAKIPTDWSRDGEYLVYTEGPGPWQVWALPLRGTRTPIPYLQAPFDVSGARFSPDRRWVAYTASGNASGGDTFRVYVEPFPGGGGKWQISATGGPACHPRWRSDGREIFYTTGTAIWAVDVTTTTAGSFSAGAPHKLFDATVLYAGSAVNNGYDVTPDGQRFLLIANKSAANNVNRPIRVVVNWNEPRTR